MFLSSFWMQEQNAVHFIALNILFEAFLSDFKTF